MPTGDLASGTCTSSTQPARLRLDQPGGRAELERTLRFWLDRGVDGFRVDVAHGLVKKAGLPDWTRRSRTGWPDHHPTADVGPARRARHLPGPAPRAARRVRRRPDPVRRGVGRPARAAGATTSVPTSCSRPSTSASSRRRGMPRAAQERRRVARRVRRCRRRRRPGCSPTTTWSGTRRDSGSTRARPGTRRGHRDRDRIPTT